MKIFHQIKDSIYGPAYYKQIVGEMRLRSSIKYLARLSLIIAILAAVIFTAFYPKIKSFLYQASSKIVASYPTDLEIDIKAGNASANKPEPFFIPMPDFGLHMENARQYVQPRNLLAINTKENFSAQKFREYDTFILLSKNELSTLQNSRNGEIRIMPLSEIGDTKLTHEKVVETQNVLASMMPSMFVFAVVLVFASFFLMFFSATLVLNFIFGFFIWIFAKTLKINLPYKKSYQVGIHASTLANLLSIFSVFGIVPAFGKLIVKILIVFIVKLM